MAAPTLSWDTITTDMVMSRFNDAERNAYQAMQGGADPLAVVLADVVATVRGKCLAGGNQLGPNGTSPNSLKIDIMSMAIWLWITGFTKNVKLQTDGREKNYEQAIAALEKVASGTQKVELPDAGTAQVLAAPVNAIEQVSGECRKFTRDRMKGL